MMPSTHKFICPMCDEEKPDWELLYDHIFTLHEMNHSNRIMMLWNARDPSLSIRVAYRYLLEMANADIKGILEDFHVVIPDSSDDEAPER